MLLEHAPEASRPLREVSRGCRRHNSFMISSY
jgi:hypothetical protein